MQIIINGLEEWALIDTGSQITCISEDLYKRLSSRVRLEELPASKVYVVMAIGKKSTTIQKQILAEININNDVFTFVFLVVPFLTTHIILGHDWLIKNEVIMNYKTGNLVIRNNVVPRNLILFEHNSSDRVSVHTEEEITYVHILQTIDFNNRTNKSVNLETINYGKEGDEK